ncbi:hypothetical protein AIOL_000807 [Candidatus Rhodobacter oscarellae]|uniref:Uncharacterized protein n=1 Tax=Candidatus Rhodobacter oscarellae TaxID=1675527 RepID=A0A0J9H4Z6_9RHOB|nr:hypothetical protein [Candidatus Rhodobacter lobularis]KMW60643.1 hypothetical protein AIOL_000807 [Candidatus Rhodobacter lobularis]
MKVSFWQRFYWLWLEGWLLPSVLVVASCVLLAAPILMFAPRPHVHERFEVARVVSSMAAQLEGRAHFLYMIELGDGQRHQASTSKGSRIGQIDATACVEVRREVGRDRLRVLLRPREKCEAGAGG